MLTKPLLYHVGAKAPAIGNSYGSRSSLVIDVRGEHATTILDDASNHSFASLATHSLDFQFNLFQADAIGWRRKSGTTREAKCFGKEHESCC